MLGWNEFMIILTSPTYLILVSFFGFIGYVIWLLNLFGPVETFIRMIVSEIVKIGSEKVRTSLQPGGTGEKLTQYFGGDTSSISKKEQ